MCVSEDLRDVAHICSDYCGTNKFALAFLKMYFALSLNQKEKGLFKKVVIASSESNNDFLKV